MKTYLTYIWKSLLSSYFLSCILFILIFVLGDLFSHFYIFLKATQKTRTFIGFLILSHYFALLPRIYHMLAPFIITFASLFSILRLKNRRELLIFISSGIPLYKIIGAFLIGTLFLSFSIFLNLEWVLPKWPFHGISSKLENWTHPSPLVDGKNRILYARTYYPISKEIRFPHKKSSPHSFAFVLLERTQTGLSKRIILAKTAKWSEKKEKWLLRNVQIKDIHGKKAFLNNPPYHLPLLWLKTDIFPKDLESVSGMREDFLGVLDLWDGYQRRRLYKIKIKLFSRLASFFLPFLLTLIGASFLLMPHTLGAIGSMLWALLTMFLFLLSIFLFEALGMAKVLPSLFSIFFPYFVFAILGIEALGKVET
ncbi:MAG: LptF/LptG family permease [Planctomycetota bacterium]|nr:MAG: LptF/LptG family permease [Planctomycetota bacterium]